MYVAWKWMLLPSSHSTSSGVSLYRYWLECVPSRGHDWHIPAAHNESQHIGSGGSQGNSAPSLIPRSSHCPFFGLVTYVPASCDKTSTLLQTDGFQVMCMFWCLCQLTGGAKGVCHSKVLRHCHWCGLLVYPGAVWWCYHDNWASCLWRGVYTSNVSHPAMHI